MKSLEEWVRELVTPGTPQCAVFYGIVGIILALFLIFLGFWKTLFVALLCAAGIFTGGVKEKDAFIKKIFNKLLPPPK